MEKKLKMRLMLSFAIAAASSGLARAEEPVKPAKAWKETAELSIVSANGNSKSTTGSFKNLFNYDWTRFGLEIEGGALRAESQDKTTAEQYFASEKGSFKMTGKDYLFEKYRWDRNRFAGIDHRHDASAGYGRQLIQTANDQLFTELGGGYINEERIGAARNDFAAGRGYAKYIRQLSKTANFSQDFEYLHNFEDKEDYRMNTETAVTASITTHFSIKASFVWKRTHKPPVGFIRDDTFTSVALIANY